MNNKNIFYLVLFLCLLGGVVSSCRDSDTSVEVYNPEKPVVFGSYEPAEGSVRTPLFINGSNFGKDLSRIKVMIGDTPVKVIGSTGETIFCIVPRRVTDGTIKVNILDDKGKVAVEHVFANAFNYIAKTTVGTLAGKLDPSTNTSSMIDGMFDEAEFIDPYWLVFDTDQKGHDHLYLVEVDKALRDINLTEEYVSTIVTNGQAGLNKIQTITMDITGDTIFFVDDNGQNNTTRAVLSYSIRSENFKRVYPYIFDRTGYSCAQHPDGSLFYNTLWGAAVLKARGQQNPTTQAWESKSLFTVVGNVNGHTYMTMHPEGKYAYITGATYTAVYRSMYDPATRELTAPEIFVGRQQSAGYVDAPGTQARFGNPVRQGVFVKNKKYVDEGRDDVYDFYLCDAANNCIRKITPDGEVDTFAGRGTQTGTTAQNASGYVDGDPRLEARFKTPVAIAYDEANEIFYVGDKDNKRIRYIAVE